VNTWDFDLGDAAAARGAGSAGADTTPTRRQRLVRRMAIVFGGLTMGGAALAIALGGTASTPVQPVQHATLVAAGVTNPIGYKVEVASGTGCTTTQTANGIYVVPTLIGIGGHIVPDLLVTVIPLPPIPPLTTSTFAQINITRLGPPMPLRVRVVLSPSADENKVAAGYDACDNTAPKGFTAIVNESDTDLNVTAQSNQAGNDLTVLGETFTDVNGVETNPTKVTAALSPVPQKITADIKTLADASHTADVTTTSPTNVNLNYLQVTPTSSVNAIVGLNKLPSTANVKFSSTNASYTTSAPIADATLNLTTTATGEKSQLIKAHLVNLPTSASFTRSSDTSATLTTRGTIGDATVRFASFTPGTTLPAEPTDPAQHLNATINPNLTLADFEMRGVGTSNVSFGDPIEVHAKHTAGPFDINVQDAPAPDDKTSVIGSVLDLPATVDLSYAKATQAVHYTGSAVIGSINVSLTADKPFALRATQASLTATNVPAGLDTNLDPVAKTFTATTTGTPLGKIQLALTNGPNNPVPAGDGLYLLDDAPSDPTPPVDTPFQAYAQVSNLTSVTVGMANPIEVNVHHSPGSFAVDATIATKDKDTGEVQHLHITGTLVTLPATADVRYDAPDGATASTVTYTASDRMPEITLDVTSSKEFIDNSGATMAHLDLTDIPSTLTANIDTADKQVIADVPSGAGLGGLSARITSGPIEDAAGGDRVVFQQRIAPDPNPGYLAFIHLSGITHAVVGWGDPTHIQLTHTAGPFDVNLVKQEMKADPDANQVLNTTTLNAHIVNLPASVDLTYASDAATAISYTGSDSINEIDVDGTSSPLPFQGRGSNLHSRILGVPTGLNLSENFGDDNSKFSANTTGGSLGLLELSIDNGTDDRGLLNGNDGVLIEDMAPPKDADTSIDPATAPYQLFARATGLVSINYNASKPEILVPTDGRQISAFDDTTHIDATLTGGHDLQFLQRKYGGLIEGDNPVQPKKEGFTYVQAVFHAPPQNLNVDLHQQTLVDGDDWKTTVDYHTDSTTRPDGSTLAFSTNSGKNVSRLEADMSPVPATASACVSTDRRVCVNHDDFPDGFNSDGTNKDDITGGTSFAVQVSQPVQLTLFDCDEDLRINSGSNSASADVAKENGCADEVPTGIFSYTAHRTNATLNVSNKVAIMEATNESCFPDCKLINIDTNGAQLQGRVVQQKVSFTAIDQNPVKFYQNTLHLEFPTGYAADDRIVQIGCGAISGCSGDPSHGRISCPPGTTIVAPLALGIDSNFAEEFCSKASVSNISPNTLGRGQSATVELTGLGLSSGSPISLRPDNNIGPALTITNVTWLDFDHVTFDVTVPENASTGKYTLRIENDNDISDTVLPGVFTVTSG